MLLDDFLQFREFESQHVLDFAQLCRYIGIIWLESVRLFDVYLMLSNV